MPREGTGSIARFGRRLAAVAVDWFLCELVAVVLFHVRIPAQGAASFMPLGLFLVENLLLVSTVGSTVGHRLVGLRVGALGQPSLSPVQVVVRSVLLCLFIPAVVWDKNQRGLHDRVAGTVIVRT